MSKTKLSCENCGSVLTKIENDDKTYVCLHCGSKVVVEPDINKTINNYEVKQNITKNIYGSDKLEYSEIIYKIETFIKLKNYDKALSFVEDAVNENPGDYQVWWLSAKAKLLKNIDCLSDEDALKEQSVEIDESFKQDYKNALTLVDEENKESLRSEYKELKDAYLLVKNPFDNVDKKDGAGIPNAQVAVGIFVALGVFFTIIGIILAATSVTENVVVILPGIVFIVLAIVINSSYKKDVEMYEVIIKHERISIDELNDKCLLGEYTNERVEKKVKMFIENGYLRGYKCEDGMVFRTFKKSKKQK